MKYRARTVPAVSLHAVATVIGGGVFGWLGGVIGSQVGAAESWAAIGYAILGVLIGVIIGSYATAVLLGRALRFAGSALFAVLGAIIGAIGIVLAIGRFSETVAGPSIGFAFYFAALLVCYHAPWRSV